eukprot:TRINITY_DN1601_c0_g1_i1.p1 TRINITY_DN1601_c0_g1~~TRINITY_DN1601_c0_g1_i1.p1  ORF type:complete len:349 (+),score=119.01 TRINITY_DN1601_c0_g1_i1:260-1306(+)
MSPNSSGRRMEKESLISSSSSSSSECLFSSSPSSPPEASSLPNPFTNEIHLSLSDKFLLFLGTLFLLPIRSLLVLLSLGLAWLVAKIGLCGLSGEAVEGQARKGWRRHLLSYYGVLAKLVFWSAGFRIIVKGRQASRTEAPILVGAPHSSFLEGVIIVMCGGSPVSRHENRHAILISAVQLFFQTIFVDRRKSDSRKATMEMIRKRALDPDNDYTQVFLCPEGTNTNRKVLIKFKIGAFAPGVPVQPVLIRYPGYERVDAITWTYHQSHSYAYSVWLLLARPFNTVEVEFLPVYKPSQEEKDSAELYAKNVQELMAKHLQIPATELTYSKYYEEYVKSYEQTRPKKDD